MRKMKEGKEKEEEEVVAVVGSGGRIEKMRKAKNRNGKRESLTEARPFILRFCTKTI